MQATPEFVVPTQLSFAVLIIFAITIVYKWAGLTDRQFPFRGESGFWYKIGRRGRMSKYQVIWDWIALAIAVGGLVLTIQNFFQALTNPTGLVFNTLGNLLYVLSGGDALYSNLFWLFVLFLSWVMSGPENPWG